MGMQAAGAQGTRRERVTDSYGWISIGSATSEHSIGPAPDGAVVGFTQTHTQCL
jgi:hypothetical protein